MAAYALPDLPYDYGALEPHISGEVMELHHSQYHQGYVTGANTALEQLAEARAAGRADAVVLLQRALTFNVAGHMNHSVFWPNMCAGGGDRPDGELGAAIDDQFGSFDAFRRYFATIALGIQGSGWAILACDGLARKLVVLEHHDHQGSLSLGLVPLLMLDMWEHAFHLQYRTGRAEYVQAWWNVANWADAAKPFAAARTNHRELITA